MKDSIVCRRHEMLTVLGRKLCLLPVHPQFGKMVIYAAIFKCVDPIVSMVALMSEGDPFKMTRSKKKLNDIRKRFVAEMASDHLMLANIFQHWERTENRGKAANYSIQLKRPC